MRQGSLCALTNATIQRRLFELGFLDVHLRIAFRHNKTDNKSHLGLRLVSTITMLLRVLALLS